MDDQGERNAAALRSAYGRQIGPGVALGALSGGLSGLVSAIGPGSESPAWAALLYGAIGAVAAAVGGALALLAVLVAVETGAARAARVASAAVVAGAGAAAIVLWALTVLRSSPPWAAILVGCFAAACATVLALRAERRAVRAGAPLPRHSSAGVAAMWPIIGGSGAFAAGGFTVHLIREQLHVACGTGPPGSEDAGSWTCADGISYLWIAIALGGMTVLTVVIAALVGGLMRSAGLACGALVALAVLNAGSMLLLTWDASSRLVWSTPPGVASTAYWVASVMPAALIAAASLAIAVAAVAGTGRTSAVLLWTGAGGLLVATVVQPGLGIAALPAASFLASAAARKRPTASAAGRPTGA